MQVEHKSLHNFDYNLLNPLWSRSPYVILTNTDKFSSHLVCMFPFAQESYHLKFISTCMKAWGYQIHSI